jgi:hypothetical protein
VLDHARQDVLLCQGAGLHEGDPACLLLDAAKVPSVQVDEDMPESLRRGMQADLAAAGLLQAAEQQALKVLASRSQESPVRSSHEQGQ